MVVAEFLRVFSCTSRSSSSSASEVSGWNGLLGEDSSKLGVSKPEGGGEPVRLVCLESSGDEGNDIGVSGEMGTGGEAMRTVLGFGDDRIGGAGQRFSIFSSPQTSR